jgi:UDP-galactose transporter B1
MEAQRLGLLLCCIAGIYCSYLTQGLVSEHLSTKRYGTQQERFPGLIGVNGLQSLVCCLWAWVLLSASIKMGRIRASDLPSWTEYWRAGITNCIGPACGMISLRNISYSAQVRPWRPTPRPARGLVRLPLVPAPSARCARLPQVLAKSCKMVPVMIAGSIVGRKRYSPVEYVCMSLVGLGVAMFAQAKQSAKAAKVMAGAGAGAPVRRAAPPACCRPAPGAAAPGGRTLWQAPAGPAGVHTLRRQGGCRRCWWTPTPPWATSSAF